MLAHIALLSGGGAVIRWRFGAGARQSAAPRHHAEQRLYEVDYIPKTTRVAEERRSTGGKMSSVAIASRAASFTPDRRRYARAPRAVVAQDYRRRGRSAIIVRRPIFPSGALSRTAHRILHGLKLALPFHDAMLFVARC